ADPDILFGHFFLGQAESLAHAYDLVGCECAGAEAALMAAAVHLRFEADTRFAADVEGADTFRAVGLVSREAHQVDLEFGEVDLHLAGGLGGIDVEDDAGVAADFAQFGNRLDDADFVIDEHHRGQYGIGTDGRLEDFQVEQAVFLDVEIGRLETLALHFADGVEHGLVLGLDRDDVLALGAGVEITGALDGEVVGLGGTGGPDDFLGIGTDQRRDLLARLFDRRIGHPAEAVRTRSRVAEVLVQVRNHFFRNAWVNRGGCRVIQVNGKFHRHSR